MKRYGIGLLTLGIALGLGTQVASAADNPATAQELSTIKQNVIQNVGTAYVLGRPDLAGAYSGVRAYLDKDYTKAMKSFKRGARYGDKLSQLSIGLMYLNGEGVAADAPTAWAWIDLAAQSKNPGYVATRDQVWAQLDEAQRTLALSTLKELAGTYDDTVTTPRLRREMQHNKIERLTFTPAERANVAVSLTPVHVR